MGTLKEWLDNQIDTLKTGIEKNRGYNYYFKTIFTQGPFYTIKSGGKVTFSTRGGATYIEMPPLKTETVVPKKIEIQYPRRYGEVYVSNTYIVWHGVIDSISKQENEYVIETFTKDSEHVEMQHSLTDLKKSRRNYRVQGWICRYSTLTFSNN